MMRNVEVVFFFRILVLKVPIICYVQTRVFKKLKGSLATIQRKKIGNRFSRWSKFIVILSVKLSTNLTKMVNSSSTNTLLTTNKIISKGKVKYS